MSNDLVYKEHWGDPRFREIFFRFKDFVLDIDKDFAKQSADLIIPYLSQNKIDILEIGPGNGLVTLSFLERLTGYTEVRNYTGVDVSQEFIDLLESKRDQFKKFCQGRIVFECADASIYEIKKEADLIVAFNSWYGIPFEKVDDYLRALRSRGVLAILLNSRYNITTCLTREIAGENIIVSEDLNEWLSKRRVKHQRYVLYSFTNREDFLNKKGLNPKAEFFYRYMLRRIDQPLSDIFEYLAKKTDNSFRLPQELIIIKK